MLLRAIVKGPIDPNQAWFWTPEWQAKEQQAFESDEALLAALDERSGSSDADV